MPRFKNYLNEVEDVQANEIAKIIDKHLDEIFEEVHKIIHPPGTTGVNRALMKFAIDYLKKEASGKMPRW